MPFNYKTPGRPSFKLRRDGENAFSFASVQSVYKELLKLDPLTKAP